MGRYLGQIQGCSIPPTKKQNGQHQPSALEPVELSPGGEGWCPASERGWYRKRNPLRRMALLSLMGTLPHVSAPRKVAALLALVAAAAACGGGSPTIVASRSPSAQPSPQVSSTPSSLPSTAGASPTPVPRPVNGAFAVLVSSQAPTSYAVSVIGVDCKVVASAQ